MIDACFRFIQCLYYNAVGHTVFKKYEIWSIDSQEKI